MPEDRNIFEEYCIRCFCCGKPLDLFDMQVIWDILTTPNIDPNSNYADFKRKSICKECFKHSKVERLDERNILILGDGLCLYKGRRVEKNGQTSRK